MITDAQKSRLAEELKTGNTDTLTEILAKSFVEFIDADDFQADLSQASAIISYGNILLHLAMKNGADKQCDCPVCRARRGESIDEENGPTIAGPLPKDIIQKIKNLTRLSSVIADPSSLISASPPLWKMGPYFATYEKNEDGSVHGFVVGIKENVAFSGPDDESAHEDLKNKLTAWVDSGVDITPPSYTDIIVALKDKFQPA